MYINSSSPPYFEYHPSFTISTGLNKFHGLEDENFLLVLPEIQRKFQAAQMAIENQPQCMSLSIPYLILVFSV